MLGIRITRRTLRRGSALIALIVLAVAAALPVAPAAAEPYDILQEWDGIQAPPPPPIRPMRLEARTTALISMDFSKASCSPQRRPRCVAALPRIAALLAAARRKGMMVAHFLTPMMQRGDIVAELAPLPDEPSINSRGDKFFGTDLETMLKARGITTVLLVGTQANGSVLFTTVGAVVRGFKAVVPIDAIPADTGWQEKFAIWEIANAPGVAGDATLTRTDLLDF
jgi:nicotinamidase-related amidase